jgi:hypothetical protein
MVGPRGIFLVDLLTETQGRSTSLGFAYAQFAMTGGARVRRTLRTTSLAGVHHFLALRDFLQPLE